MRDQDDGAAADQPGHRGFHRGRGRGRRADPQRPTDQQPRLPITQVATALGVGFEAVAATSSADRAHTTGCITSRWRSRRTPNAGHVAGDSGEYEPVRLAQVEA
ncbi:MAG: hypothetical protein ACRDSF_23785 [Pseudonocardiaceae bacterium]